MSKTARWWKRLGRRAGTNGETEFPHDFDPQAIEIIRRVEPFTMTSPERIFSLLNAVEYVVANGIPGDFVECGVWKGGSSMAMALSLMKQSSAARHLHLFDTYEGMSEPSEVDRDFRGTSASDRLATEDKATSAVWAYCPLDDVRSALYSTGYSTDHIHFVEGKVEDTLPAEAPDEIALLRLDTDWYESTLHELVHLYPRLSVGGVMIIDDYGDWAGARRAVDEYIQSNGLKLLLSRIDDTGRLCVKLES